MCAMTSQSRNDIRVVLQYNIVHGLRLMLRRNNSTNRYDSPYHTITFMRCREYQRRNFNLEDAEKIETSQTEEILLCEEND